MMKRSSVVCSLHVKINFKILLIGELSIGKTSLIQRFVKDTFSKKQGATIGVQFYSKNIPIGSQQVSIQLWDTAGQQNFKSLVKSFFNKSSCIVIVYSSPINMQKIIEDRVQQINQYAPSAVRIMLVRTKIDVLPMDEDEKMAVQEIKIRNNIDIFMEVSAKDGTNVNKFFESTVKFLHRQYAQNPDFKELVEPTKDSFFIDCQTQAKRHSVFEERKKKRCC